jgi:hypothetical protein
LLGDKTPDKVSEFKITNVTDSTTLIVPEVGMTFKSEEKAYDMYNTYALHIGFIELEIAIQSDEEIGHYVRNIWFAVTKVIEKLSH